MSDFSFNLNDLLDSQSVTARIKQNYYPNDKQIIQNTSQSQTDNFSRSLMSRDVMKIMQGEALIRNPANVMALYEQNTRATMHTILSMGGDIDDSVKVPDPDDPTKFLTGAAARAEIARKSIMTTGLAPSGFESAVRAFISSSSSSSTANSQTANGIVKSDGDFSSHSTESYYSTDSSQVFNNGNRSIAVINQLSEQEKQEYKTKASQLLSKKNLDIASR